MVFLGLDEAVTVERSKYSPALPVDRGVGDVPRVGRGSFEADSLGFVLTFLRGGDACFSGPSEDEGDGSSSSWIPGKLGGRDIRLNWGDVGLVSRFCIGRLALGDGGVGGALGSPLG